MSFYPQTGQLLETIKIFNKKIFNLDYHNFRLNKSREKLWAFKDFIDLKNFLHPPDEKLYKVRVLYDQVIKNIEYLPYQKKSIKSFKLINSNISYPYKFADRKNLEKLYSLKEGADDIIIIKDQKITDTFAANLAFFKDNKWLTPASPLLPGTTREKLLKEKKIYPAIITIKDLKKIKKIAIMNCMIGFKEIKEKNPILNFEPLEYFFSVRCKNL